jgi:hypothetical protein
MGVKVFDQESRRQVEVFCDNDPLMPKDQLPFEDLAGKTDRCDLYFFGDLTIDREHPDHVCGLTAQESVNRLRSGLYGDLKWRLPYAVFSAWPMPIGAESIRAFAARRGVEPLSMLPALTELGDAWIGMAVRVEVRANGQVVGWVRLYGLVERVESDGDSEAATVWEYGRPRVTVEYSKSFPARSDPVAKTARKLWEWHTKHVLHQPLTSSGRSPDSGAYSDRDVFRQAVLNSIRGRKQRGVKYTQRDVATDLAISERHLRTLLNETHLLSWRELRRIATS